MEVLVEGVVTVSLQMEAVVEVLVVGGESDVMAIRAGWESGTMKHCESGGRGVGDDVGVLIMNSCTSLTDKICVCDETRSRSASPLRDMFI